MAAHSAGTTPVAICLRTQPYLERVDAQGMTVQTALWHRGLLAAALRFALDGCLCSWEVAITEKVAGGQPACRQHSAWFVLQLAGGGVSVAADASCNLPGACLLGEGAVH